MNTVRHTFWILNWPSKNPNQERRSSAYFQQVPIQPIKSSHWQNWRTFVSRTLYSIDCRHNKTFSFSTKLFEPSQWVKVRSITLVKWWRRVWREVRISMAMKISVDSLNFLHARRLGAFTECSPFVELLCWNYWYPDWNWARSRLVPVVGDYRSSHRVPHRT